MIAKTHAHPTIARFSPAFARAHRRHGRRHAAKTTPAARMRNQATPSGSIRAKSSTAKAGPR